MIILTYCLATMIIMAFCEFGGLQIRGSLLRKSLMVLFAPIIFPIAFVGGVFCLCFTRWS